MKVTREQLKAFTLKVEEAAKENFGVTGIVLDSEAFWIDTEGRTRYPNLPRNLAIMRAGFEFDLMFKKED